MTSEQCTLCSTASGLRWCKRCIDSFLCRPCREGLRHLEYDNSPVGRRHNMWGPHPYRNCCPDCAKGKDGLVYLPDEPLEVAVIARLPGVMVPPEAQHTSYSPSFRMIQCRPSLQVLPHSPWTSDHASRLPFPPDLQFCVFGVDVREYRGQQQWQLSERRGVRVGLGIEHLVGHGWEAWAVILDPQDWISWFFVRVDQVGAVLEICPPNQGAFLDFTEDKPEMFIRFVAAFWGMCPEERKCRILRFARQLDSCAIDTSAE